jgi:hypothetical protein
MVKSPRFIAFIAAALSTTSIFAQTVTVIGPGEATSIDNSIVGKTANGVGAYWDSLGNYIPLTDSHYTNVEPTSTQAGTIGGVGRLPNNIFHAVLIQPTSQGCVTADLHPSTYDTSAIFGVYGTRQVGYVRKSGTLWATAWKGTSTSFTLLPMLPNHRNSFADKCNSTQVVGYTEVPTTGPYATLWTYIKSSWSVANLNPTAAISSRAAGVSVSGQQVGYYTPKAKPNLTIACLWNGTAASFVSLQPRNYEISAAWASNGSTQVGMYYLNGTATYRACKWSGSASTFVDLHASLGAGFVTSKATGIDPTTGKICGWATDTSNQIYVVTWQ